MQFSLHLETENRLLKIHRLLLSAFGRPAACIRLDPVSQLVLTMLSARTRSRIAKRAFEKLANRFAQWEMVAHLPAQSLYRMIYPVTFAERKAIFLPRALQHIMQLKGSALSLDFLDAWPVDEAQTWLESLPGIGPKTSAAILNFSPLHKPVLVVDTAHLRAAARIGLVPPKASIAIASRMLAQQIPYDWSADDIEDHHLLMQRLGQTYCTFNRPDCPGCPVHAICQYTL